MVRHVLFHFPTEVDNPAPWNDRRSSGSVGISGLLAYERDPMLKIEMDVHTCIIRR